MSHRPASGLVGQPYPQPDQDHPGGLLCVAAASCLGAQAFTRPGPPAERTAPLPAWARPPLAVLGSSWLGIGTGLLVRPGFWAGFVPWHTNRVDAQALGVWTLALGVGVLGSLAEDDVDRTRAALLSLPGTALALTVVLAARTSHVHWSSGPGLGLTVTPLQQADVGERDVPVVAPHGAMAVPGRSR
ncbi:hypothetical protein [Streptomyces roseochromogenus]|uniref:Uncharacterized protein n=1 Tax=Streptomyces roseochromogenus subsp. oscitans DS 12.976 TaxID=1352936 RepID=V6JIH6_STRRC|nr:hypothetical protein [Streptomyces roseochromogenus]EST19528.1 hypothetical protein M878_42035 [Streptomyces roseochromogenus subsp. oscitans DS 12.976]